MNFNRVILGGRLIRDVEIRTTANNQNVASFGIAINRSFKTKDGEKRDETTFVDCEAWGRTAETIAQYFSKGQPILIEGKIKQDTWQDKETGQNRSKIKVLVDSFTFVGDGNKGDRKPAPKNRGGQSKSPPPFDPIEEEDIPF